MPDVCLDALNLQLDLIRRFRSDPRLWVLAHRALALPADDGGDRFDALLAAEEYDRVTELAHTWAEDGLIMGRILNDAATYWVSPEMTRFLNYAHQDMPQPQIKPDDIPSAAGFIYFAEPLHFQLGPGSPGVIVWAYDSDQLLAAVFQRNALGHPAPVQWLGTTQGPIALDPSDTCDLLLQAFWVLSQQRIAVTERRPVERHARKRAARSGFEIPEDGIRVVTLRRPEMRTATGDHVVDWSHRWIVSGHWRDQWYPSAEEHRPKWIDTYTKGPEDRPLVLKDRVYKWDR